MNNKGFTLIELLAVSAILATIGIVITISLTASLNNQNQKNCDAFVQELEDAASVYAGLKSSNCANPCEIKVQTLVIEGLINSEIDACTGTLVENIEESVTVTCAWSNIGEKSCVYNGVKTYAR